MRKLVQALLLAGALLCHVVVTAQTSVTVGTSTTTSQRQPFGTFWGYERSATIYHASDLGPSGVIDSLAWYFNINRSPSSGLRIYLKHTTNNNFANLTTWSNETAGARLVYADSGYTLVSGQWNEFTLDDTFTYYNSENLMVLVETNTGGGGDGNGSSLTTARYSTSSITNTHQYWNADNNPPTGGGSGRNNQRANIKISKTPLPIPDIRVGNVLSPLLAGCNVSSYSLQFAIENSGGTTLTSGSYIRYNYSVNSGTAVVDSLQLTADINPLGSITHTIQINNTSGISTLNIAFGIDMDIDPIKTNNNGSITVNNPNCIATNYATDFESGAGDWNSNTLWQHGTIAKGTLNNPPSGTQGFITNLSGNYPDGANASLYSPYFDFSVSCNPLISWAMRFDSENNWDGMILEASSDDVNWTKITAITPAYNNNSNSGPLPAPKFSGDNGSWNNFTADLSGFSGLTNVRIRFRFASDGSGNDNGFAIDDVSFTLYPSYTVSFNAPDTAFINALNDKEITNTSPIQTGVNYRWIYNGNIVSTDYDLDFAFPASGAQNLTLRAVDPCGAILDSVVKTVIVITPSQKAIADFVSDINTVAQFGTVNYTNLSENGPTYYEWFVSPAVWVDPITNLPLASISYDNGTNMNSKSPVMSFFGTGEYDICLIAENSVGRDTLCKTDYIIVGGGAAALGADSIMCSGNGVDAAVKPQGKIWDSGGPNQNYLDNENCTFVIDFACYDSLYLDFSTFAVEQGWDYLRIYDGDDLTGTPLWNTNVDPDGFTGFAIPTVPVATSGKVTLVFESDGIFNEPGFELNYRAASQITTIVADFDVPDTICATYQTSFVNRSTGAQTYEWDFFGNGSNNSTDANPSFTYGNGGTFIVRLIVKGCAGSDTAFKTVVVNNPGQNIVAFSSPFTTYTTNDVVQLNNETNGCVDDFTWRIEPNRATFLNGSQFSANPEVMFDTAGVYTITLVTTNAAGTDSLVRSNYITINPICMPKIDNNLPDMGIVRVTLEDIDNTSATDLNYTDYPDQSTELMKGATYEVRVQRQTTSNDISRKVWVDWNADGDFDDAGELIASDGPSRSILLSEMFTVPRNAVDGIVTMRVATSYGNQANDPCGNRAYGETEDYRLVLYADPIAPVITMIGSDTIIINRNDSYTDQGATASDNLDGIITPAIIIQSNVDTAVAGTYQVTYEVTDTAGNTSTLVRTVIVLPDAPSMTLNGLANDTMEVFSAYNDLGADALDFNNQQLAVTVDRGQLDTAVVGVYTVNYTSTDQNGRSTTLSRVVNVVDRTAPMGYLVGPDTITVEVFSDINDPGLTTTDNYCAVNTYLPSYVDVNTIGYKTRTYTVEDCYGNTSTVDRVIHVVDTEAPMISLSGDMSANVIRLRTYADAGYTLSDNYNSAAEITIDTITTLVNTFNVGLYTWQYVATDASGNSSKSEIRFIYVIDNVGIADIQVLDLEVYPNPNRGQFSLKAAALSGDKVNIRVTDMSSKIVHIEDVQNFSGEHALSLDNATPGVYLVHVIQGNQQAVTKIVINK